MYVGANNLLVSVLLFFRIYDKWCSGKLLFLIIHGYTHWRPSWKFELSGKQTAVRLRDALKFMTCCMFLQDIRYLDIEI